MPKRPQKRKSNQPSQPDQPVPPEHPDAKPEPGDIGLQAIATLDKHKKTVIIGTLVAAIAICAGLVLRQIADHRQTVAAEAYSQAASERSLEKLDAVVADHSGSVAAGNALLTKSEIHLSMEKNEDAKITLLTFVEDYKKHPRYVQGLLALGSLHHDTGDRANAADFYEQALAAGPDSDIAPLIVIRQGDLDLEEADELLKAGKTAEAEAKKEEARIHYDDSARRINFRSNRFIPIAEEKIELLAIGNVPVVPAPPAPPKPEKPEPVKPAPGTGTVLKPGESAAPTPTPKGEAPKAKGEAPKAKGEAPKAKGEAPKAKGEAPKAKGEAPKAKGEAPKAKGEAPKKTEDPNPSEPATTEKPAVPKPAPAENPASTTPASDKPDASTPKPAGESSQPAEPAPAEAPAPKPE